MIIYLKIKKYVSTNCKKRYFYRNSGDVKIWKSRINMKTILTTYLYFIFGLWYTKPTLHFPHKYISIILLMLNPIRNYYFYCIIYTPVRQNKIAEKKCSIKKSEYQVHNKGCSFFSFCYTNNITALKTFLLEINIILIFFYALCSR